jgi:rod shape-determining protein MreC
VPIAKVVKLDDDGAIALPLADPSTISFAVVQPEYVPEAMGENADAEAEEP